MYAVSHECGISDEYIYIWLHYYEQDYVNACVHVYAVTMLPPPPTGCVCVVGGALQVSPSSLYLPCPVAGAAQNRQHPPSATFTCLQVGLCMVHTHMGPGLVVRLGLIKVDIRLSVTIE